MDALCKKIIFKIVKPFVKLCSKREHWEENIFRAKRIIFGDDYVIADAHMQTIDKKIVDQQIASMGDWCGIEVRDLQPEIIVSLTTYPARIGDVRYTLYSLLHQTLKPHKILVWLAEEEFPDKVEPLSAEFAKHGVTIAFCSNMKSYKKLIPTLQKHPESVIVTADDDIYYEPTWLEKLVTAYRENPTFIHCHRAHLLRLNEQGEPLPYRKWKSGISWELATPSFQNFFIGCGGVLYPPHSLYQDVTSEPLFMELAPIADDIWFWAMAVKQGTKINVVQNNISEVTYVDPAKELGIGCTPLWRINVGRRMNDKQLQAVFDYYRLEEIFSAEC